MSGENTASTADLPSWTAIAEPHGPDEEEETTSGDDKPVTQLLSPRSLRHAKALPNGHSPKSGTPRPNGSNPASPSKQTTPTSRRPRGASDASRSSATSPRTQSASSTSQVRPPSTPAGKSAGTAGRPRSASAARNGSILQYVVVRPPRSNSPMKSPGKHTRDGSSTPTDLVSAINSALTQNAKPGSSSGRTTSSAEPIVIDDDSDEEAPLPQPQPQTQTQTQNQPQNIHVHDHTLENHIEEVHVAGLSPVRRTTNPNVARPRRSEDNSIIAALSAAFQSNSNSNSNGAGTSASASISASAPPLPRLKRPRSRSRSHTPSGPAPKRTHVDSPRWDWSDDAPRAVTPPPAPAPAPAPASVSASVTIPTAGPARPQRPRRGERHDPATHASASTLTALDVDRALDTRVLGVVFSPRASPSALAERALARVARRAAERYPVGGTAGAVDAEGDVAMAREDARVRSVTIPRWSEAGSFKCRLDALFGRGSMLRGFGKRPEDPVHIPSEEEEAASQASHSTLIVDIEGDADPEAERVKATRERVMSRSLQIEPRELRARAGA